MIESIKNLFLDVFPNLFSVLIIVVVIVCSLRIAYLLKYRDKFILHKELFNLIFVLYVICIFEIVTFQDVNYGTSNITPFKEIFRYSIGSDLFIKNIVCNILLFLPYGYFICYYLKNKKISLTLFLTCLVSFTIEVVQLKIGRTFDIDDVILNTFGGVLGCIIYRLLDNIKNRLPKSLRKDEVVNIFVIILIIVLFMLSFKFNILGELNIEKVMLCLR